jgi:energy-coupling factor transporter ATP-binding protein EcfA2
MSNAVSNRSIVTNNDTAMSSASRSQRPASSQQHFLLRQESVNVNTFDADTDVVQVTFDCFEIADERRWENLVHPYIVINADLVSITFIGTYLDRTNKCFFNPNTGQPLSIANSDIPKIGSDLFISLITQRIPVFDNFNTVIKEKKFLTLCKVMGLDEKHYLVHDPDISYELTLDNCLKMIAIYLRFYCNIPVVIMGETGCGKTSLVRYLSMMLLRKFARNLVHVKIHGGTSAADLCRRLEEAEQLSVANYNSLGEENRDKSIITCLLFFDEANTTEHVGLIKEIMCDLTVNGRRVDLEHGLKMIAAVNPYRKHSREMIDKLENAGLGFYMSSSDTKEKFGHIPIRHLVYRVQQLPTSLMPLVWDYGQLEKNVERRYVENMVKRVIRYCKISF